MRPAQHPKQFQNADRASSGHVDDFARSHIGRGHGQLNSPNHVFYVDEITSLKTVAEYGRRLPRGQLMDEPGDDPRIHGMRILARSEYIEKP